MFLGRMPPVHSPTAPPFVSNKPQSGPKLGGVRRLKFDIIS